MSTTSNTFAETTIVAFHIGRGGHFHNPGHLSYIGEEKIGKYTDQLFLDFEDRVKCLKEAKERIGEYLWDNATVDGRKDMDCYFNDLITDEKFEELEKIFGVTKDDLGEFRYLDCNGTPVGLTYEEEQIGVGCINLDHEYDTTYTCYLSNCNESELNAILKASGYINQDILDYAKEQLGIENEQEEETEE